MLLLRLPGSFLLRFAARQFLALLFQEPPRSTDSLTRNHHWLSQPGRMTYFKFALATLAENQNQK
ncbi:MAG TPA: hypothetical protein VH120_18010 [Gemmataceae bacterium]|jgi:hypothetical protein|nr:hypothetical protein [Gemmataceae bacterium]